MKRSTAALVFVLLVALLAAVTVLGSPEPVLAEEPPAAKSGSFKVERAMTVPQFLNEVEKRAPGLLTYYPDDKHTARMTVPLATYSLDPKKLVRRLQYYLHPLEIVVIRSNDPSKKNTWIVTDMRRILKPGDPKLEPERVDLEKNYSLWTRRGYYVTASIPTKGLSRLKDVERLIKVVLSGNNVGRIKLLPDESAFEVTDFAPRVVTAHRLVKELTAIHAQAK